MSKEQRLIDEIENRIADLHNSVYSLQKDIEELENRFITFVKEAQKDNV